MTSEKEHYISLYKEVSAIPSVSSAVFLPGKKENILNVYSTWNAQDLKQLEKTSFCREYVFDMIDKNVISTTLPSDTTTILKQAFNLSGSKKAILREKKSTKNSSEGYDIEIWNEYKKENTFDLTEHEDHGKVNTNAFSCLRWSSDDRYILYTAEAKQPKSSSYFKILKASDEVKQEEIRKNQGKEYALREEWGEDFVGSHHSVLVILEISTGKTKVVNVGDTDNEISIGEAIWGPENKTIVFVGYDEFPRRLGVRSCTNRKSAIYSFDCQTSNIECISGRGNISVRCPRFSPDFKYLLYLENTSGGPHFKGSKLQKYDCDIKKTTTVVDIINHPQIDEFPGLYVVSIPVKCWFKNHMLLTSQWRSYCVILSINIDNGVIQRLEQRIHSHPEGKEETFGASTVLNVHQNFILAEFSAINIEPCLVIGQINHQGDELHVKWKYMDLNAPIKHSDVDWKVVKMNEQKDESYYDLILVIPSKMKGKTKSSAIIRAHGGPHAVYQAEFMKGPLTFAKLNYINCLVNYRGSTGYGEFNLHSLPGNVGTNDVADVQQAAEYVKSLPDLNISNFFVIGGSHGGFLAAHLIGQYPDFYRAAVLLNPVIDIAGMVETTDIPDWTWVSAGCGDMYDPSTVVSPEHLKLMWEKSPIRYGNNVHVPVLLLLGNKDLRVPFYQGLKYYRFLKSKKVPVSAYVYEDSHSLRKTPHDADVFMQTALWLEKYSS